MKKIIALTLALIMSLSCFSLTIFAEETKTTEHLTEIPEGYVGVYTKDDLDNIKLDMSGKYMLMSDIVFEDADYEKGGSFYNSGKGWEPIGTKDTPFTGVFDGNGYRIENFYINNPSGNYIGLFGYSRSGIIKNLSIVQATIVGRLYVGGIIGYIYGGVGQDCTISNCNFNGEVIGSEYVGGIAGIADNELVVSHCKSGGSISGSTYVGGIVGQQCTSPGKNQTIENYINYCVNAATVKSVDCVGGITGGSHSYYYSYYVSGSYSSTKYIGETYVQNCFNTGNIEAENNGAGGIVGYSENYSPMGTTLSNRSVESCGNSGNISALSYAGGLIGKSIDSNSNSKHSYSVGKVIATSYFGGCFGESNVKSTFCYYYDEAVSNPTNKIGISKSLDQLIKQTTFEQWDFDTVWTMEGREDYLYPELRDVPLVLPDDSKTAISGTVTVTGEAKVGSTLTAEITDISPDEATFEYLWKADGEVVGTDSSYTLTQNDVGKKITLTVKGNGDFKGEFSSSAIIGECVHSLGEYTNNNDATCEKNETRYAVCEKCGATVTEEIEGTRLPHTFTNYTYNNDATCIADGTKTAKCENCDATDTITAENTMLEHVFSDIWTIDKEATCTEEGIKSHHCKNCDATKDETVLNKLAHVYVSEITEATCDKDGKIVYTCSCGDTYSKIISATGHKDNDGDGKCDECFEYVEENNGENKPACKCICHETGIQGLLYKIFSYLQRCFKIDLLGKVFKLGRVCDCGEYHY